MVDFLGGIMAHWAEIDENNIVVRVTVGNNEDPDEGYEWLVENLGGTWIKTSYTSRAGKKINPETNEVIGDNHFRFNFAEPVFMYDEERDAFIPPKTYPSWILNEQTCLWQPPIPMPEDGLYYWDEESVSWIEYEQ